MSKQIFKNLANSQIYLKKDTSYVSLIVLFLLLISKIKIKNHFNLFQTFKQKINILLQRTSQKKINKKILNPFQQIQNKQINKQIKQSNQIKLIEKINQINQKLERKIKNNYQNNHTQKT
ncbi:transmembrane protein, putative (macronuclear) [Tetrahymena thermophila SB210]|uniref:Transmembrane protein, putative n=1 Tax=Tetrahymena thermophila (strain SB210) TaxID=312017 RepID=W7XLJ9_TETTS|nr:transmembrane protein, putative [Tetrahymena thermophila SB210]EWS76419.1 transmembrane protein, putative [Tetrahymena thermophila SB210]|eukprot:XP_012651043.1 transmembrane protein, putative [Tetrahymena thermophila SB210]